MKFQSTGSRAAYGAAGTGSPATRRGERGFTLLEALCAITILAIALSALFAAYRSGTAGVRAGSDYAHASILAESLMSAAVVSSGSDGTLAEGLDGKFAWRVAVAPASGDVANAGGGGRWALKSLVVTVAWPPRRRIELNTLRVIRTVAP